MSALVLLKTEQDFAAFRRSKGFSSEFLKLRIHFRPNQNVPRFGFIVSKKTAAKATARNLLKRRLKAKLLKLAPKVQTADFLLFPSAGLAKLKSPELEDVLNKLFTQAKIWK